MSKRCGISSIGLLVSAMLDWGKRAVARHWQCASRIVWPRVGGHKNDAFEGVRPVNVSQRPGIGFCGEDIALKELIKMLTIGDRIRIQCDDGVLLAEKISQTQFKLIDSQGMSKVVH